jgi:hypothetical protein
MGIIMLVSALLATLYIVLFTLLWDAVATEQLTAFSAAVQGLAALLLTVVAGFALRASQWQASASAEQTRLLLQDRRGAAIDALIESASRVEGNMEKSDDWLATINDSWEQWVALDRRYSRRLHDPEAQERLERFTTLFRHVWLAVGDIWQAGGEKHAADKRQLDHERDVPYPPAVRNRLRVAAKHLCDVLSALDAMQPLPDSLLPLPERAREYVWADPGASVDGYLRSAEAAGGSS